MIYDNSTGLLSQVIDQLGHTTNYQYYTNGLTQSVTDRNNHTINYAYDSGNRLISRNGLTLHDSIAYNNNGLVTHFHDLNGNLDFVYDSLNRLTSYTDYYSNQVQYEYNKVGNLLKIIYPGNNTVEYAYFDDQTLHTVKDWFNNITTYTYLNDCSLSRVDLPNGTYTTYAYDNAGRMTGMQNKKSDGTIISAYVYTLDSLGNHVSEQIQEPLQYPVLQESELTYTYDNANRILSAGPTLFNHDLNGNMTQATGPEGNYSFVFDAGNRLTQVTGQLNAAYVYDAMDHRRAVTRNGITTRYVLDISGDMDKVLVETAPGDSPLYYYIHGNGGLLYRIRAVDNAIQYYHYDSRGSTIAITNQSQGITHKYIYDAFGQVLLKEEIDFNPYRYVGKYGVIYEDSLLCYMRARYYRPDIGRFLSEDQVWGTNLFAYSGNNPINNIDPNGLATFEVSSLNYYGMKIKYNILLLDVINKNLVHEHIFFEDGMNIGWAGEGLFVESKPEEKNYSQKSTKGYNDMVLKWAIVVFSKDEKNQKYSKDEFNCQHFADKIRENYRYLIGIYNSKNLNQEKLDNYINENFNKVYKEAKRYD